MMNDKLPNYITTEVRAGTVRSRSSQPARHWSPSPGNRSTSVVVESSRQSRRYLRGTPHLRTVPSPQPRTRAYPSSPPVNHPPPQRTGTAEGRFIHVPADRRESPPGAPGPASSPSRLRVSPGATGCCCSGVSRGKMAAVVVAAVVVAVVATEIGVPCCCC
ncbi:hypothetical protein GWI33_016456 [Rhynchophorus ferrugineus]|uniref:Uncharacterized protein n=1 Tax=Rhynchophorus ferrugineus TaxID=354439 RepID=A0A834HYN7_RHYFE|nr:hypothetical protein GWI33_016456 [Rhynchophorus ferrugineus]